MTDKGAGQEATEDEPVNAAGYKRQLLELKTSLQAQEQLDQEAQQPVELDQARVGRLSRMDALQSQQMLQEVARRRQAKLLGIDGALRRIEAGEFGDCFVCGNAIDPRRLKIDPTSTRCMGCMQS